MSKWGELTPDVVFQIAWEVRDGEADPSDARRMLKLFCDCVDLRESPPPELMRFLRDAFRVHLDDGKTIESALGLARREGRPKTALDVRQSMALEILRLRMTGMRHQKCLERVASTFSKPESVIGEAWARHKFDALLLLRLERPHDEYPWTSEEVDRLCAIFAGEPWFIAPENSAS